LHPRCIAIAVPVAIAIALPSLLLQALHSAPTMGDHQRAVLIAVEYS